MPAAVIAVVSAIGTAVGGTVGAFMVMNAVAIATVSIAVGAVVVGNHQRRKAKASAIAAYNASLQDRLVMVSTATGARSRCYGRVRNVDGVLFKATRGANKEFYTLFIAVAGHEIDGFEQVYFGDKPVALDADGYVLAEPYGKATKISKRQSLTLNGSGAGSVTVTGTLVAGSATAAQSRSDGSHSSLAVSVAGSVISVSGGTAGNTAYVSWQESGFESAARVRFYTGSPTQDLSTVLQPLFPSLITAGQHRFAGIAGMLVDLEYQTDAFPTGVPSITAAFRGAKVFDPRSGATVWTENPALIARDWALYSRGGGCDTSHLVESAFSAAANACDTAQAFPVSTGITTLPLYTCSIVCRLDDDPWGTFQEIVESMAGRAGWAGGQLRVVAGVYRAPVTSITEDWISDAGAVQIIPEPPTDEAVNIYRPTIADKIQDYIAAQAPEVRAANYIAADGRELPREVTLGGVTDTTHAQHVCGVLMRDARNSLTVVLPCNLRAFQLELFDVVSVTLPRFGWSAKTFEVVGWTFGLTGGVEVTLKETAAEIYQPDSTFAVLDVTPNTALPAPSSVPTIGALAITSGTAALEDGTQVTRVNVTWPAPADRAVSGAGQVELQYWPASTALPAGDWVQAPPIPGNATETTLAGLMASTGYIFRARFVNALGVRGQWGVQVLHITAAPPAVAWASIDGKPPDNELLNLQGNYAVAVAWNFAGTGEGWYAINTATLTAGPSSITVASTGVDPIIASPGISVAGAVFDRIRARVKRTSGAGWDGRVFYATAGHSFSASYYRAIADTTVLGEWRVIEWDMAALSVGGTDWSGSTITQIRLDLGNSAADTFEVDWIGIGTVGPASYGAVWGQNVTGSAAVDAAISAAQSTANAAQATANTASTTATAAQSLLATMRGNDYLDAAEKPSIIREWNMIAGEYSGIAGQASDFGLSITAYANAYTALSVYLQGLSPSWSDVSQDTPITPAVDQAKWADYYNTRQALLNATAAEAAKRAQWAQVSGAGKPADYATRDVTFVAQGGITVTGNDLQKTGGVGGAWDASAYSRESYVGGAYVSFSPTAANTEVMVGLNTDPTFDSSWSSLDYALFCTSGGLLYAAESAQLPGPIGAWAPGDALAVTYDGAVVRYYRNGSILRSVAASITVPLYLDTSFKDLSARVERVVFGPMSAVNNIGTSQLAAGAATDVLVVETSASAWVSVTQLQGIQGSAPGPYWRRQQATQTLSFVAAVTGSVILEYFGTLKYTTPATNSLGQAIFDAEHGLRCTRTAGAGAEAAIQSKLAIEVLAPNASLKTVAVNMSGRFSITAGCSYTVSFGSARFDSTYSLEYAGEDLSAQVIKR